MEFLYLIFFARLRLWFLDVETNLADSVLYLMSAEYSVVMCGAWPETLMT